MKLMGRALTSTLFRIMNILAAGRKISLMEEGDKSLETDPTMRDSFNMGQRKDMGTMYANQEYMKANFPKGILVEKGHSATQMAELTKVNGKRDY